MKAFEKIETSHHEVACDGGGGALGHPKVWYDMSEEDHVECKYCDRLFVLNNMPISRFLEWLQQSGNLEAYMQRRWPKGRPPTARRRPRRALPAARLLPSAAPIAA